MEISNFKLEATEYRKIVFILSSLQERVQANAIFLINRNGQEIAKHAQEDSLDVQALSSLAASNLAATFGLAALIGENEFERIYHKGEKNSILINPVGEYALLLLIVQVKNERSLDLTRVRQAVLVLTDILKKCTQRIRVPGQ